MADSQIVGTEVDDKLDVKLVVGTSVSRASWERWDSRETSSLGIVVGQYVRKGAVLLTVVKRKTDLI